MPYRPVGYFLLLAAIMLCQAVSAQADVARVIADCAALASDGERVRCLEDALRATSTDNASTAGDVDVVPQEQVAEDVVDDVDSPPAPLATQKAGSGEPGRHSMQSATAGQQVATAPTPAVRTSAASAVAADAAAEASRHTGSAAAVEAAPPAAAAPMQVTQDTSTAANPATDTAEIAEVQRFGLGEIERKETLESITVTIIAIDKDPFGKQIFNTADGQVWRQTEPSAPRYRGLPFEAEIRKGAMGSFFLKPASSSRSIRVRRSR